MIARIINKGKFVLWSSKIFLNFNNDNSNLNSLSSFMESTLRFAYRGKDQRCFWPFVLKDKDWGRGWINFSKVDELNRSLFRSTFERKHKLSSILNYKFYKLMNVYWLLSPMDSKTRPHLQSIPLPTLLNHYPSASWVSSQPSKKQRRIPWQWNLWKVWLYL